jgi:hypothetical protein
MCTTVQHGAWLKKSALLFVAHACVAHWSVCSLSACMRVDLPPNRGMARVVCNRLPTRNACIGSCFALNGIFMQPIRASNLAFAILLKDFFLQNA